MADDLTLPAAGASVATDDVGGKHHQRVKLTDGTDGSSTPIGGTDTGGGVAALWVEPHTKIERYVWTPTISATLYTAGDVFGTLLTLPNAARAAGGSGFIQKIVLLDKSQAQRPAVDLVLFDQTMTIQADNATFAPSDADMMNCIGVIPLGAYNAPWAGTPTNNVATAVMHFPYVCVGTSLFGALVIRNAPTMTIGDVQIVISYTRN